MLLYFNRAPFMLVHYPIDDICLPIFENIYILIIVLLCLFYLFMYFSFFFSFFLNIYIFGGPDWKQEYYCVV